MFNRIVITALIFTALYIYLFETAPTPLPEADITGKTLPIELAFDILNKENELVRTLYTSELVGASKKKKTKIMLDERRHDYDLEITSSSKQPLKQPLRFARALHTKEITSAGKEKRIKFDERWDEGIDAAPLPAQFLRLTSNSLEKSDVRLGLYLGSDHPVNKSNLFTGQQLERFQQVKETGIPVQFYAQDTGLYIGMYADIAVSKACIVCHNEHAGSSKHDWRMGDVMGATSWTYPYKEVSIEQLLEMVVVLRQSVREAYAQVIEKVNTFETPPVIGDKWPRQGYYLPTVDQFMSRVASRNAEYTTAALITVANDKGQQEK
uniref:Tll0287-like domain-containing protein n=1 Tax=Candidatus Kentrum sp. MB TaxID=2138164 RepID=A0A450XEC6_9GAMM|nr:MAG: Protein of unknown function (DUF3365) [Candidatus Kentron sp. MB]